jgi:S-adenosylmethionine hydrolase
VARFDWISLTTDYGLSDGFVAACRGVLARLAPEVGVIDVTHDVPPGEVARGATVLAQTSPHLPPAVHLAVVDPGVGTARRGIAVEAVHGVLVGPDNGLLPAAADALGGALRAVELTNTAWHAPVVSPTFHGRDIFAPVAARLALGGELAEAGPAIDLATLVRLPDPVLVLGDGWIDAEITAIDRYGNVQLAAPAHLLDRLGDAPEVAGEPAVRVDTFGAAQPGTLLVYGDSAGRMAIAVNGGRAVAALSAAPGDVVRITARRS